jgi:hypothetical protein
MIGHFPTPFPDELIYSVCARYADRVQFPSRQGVNVELFGNPCGSTGLFLTAHLGHLIAQLPPNDYYTVDQIIANHTLFNFYSPFLPLARVKRIKEAMCGTTGKAVASSSGIGASTVAPYQYLNFCSLCAEEDKVSYGESYWHRTHQVPSVGICSKHHVSLQSSNIKIRNNSGRTVYRTAEREICSSQTANLKSDALIGKPVRCLTQRR